ncbi:hypothetical protein H0W80_00365 [Candidatus Saccharibacteria bacterium]|nr:hypothetical protein [Candidatus Saccharibacteria bacterium]
MLYFGYVTPKQFIDRISHSLNAKSSLPLHSKGLKNDAACLHIPIQAESRFVIRLEVKEVDFGSGLFVKLEFAELCLIPSKNHIEITHSTDWFRQIIGPYERKRLRQLSKKIAGMIYEHIDAIEGMQMSDFICYSFDASSDTDSTP